VHEKRLAQAGEKRGEKNFNEKIRKGGERQAEFSSDNQKRGNNLKSGQGKMGKQAGNRKGGSIKSPAREKQGDERGGHA